MRVRTTTKSLADVNAELGACFAFAGDKEPRGLVDARLRKKIAAQMKAERFKGGAGDTLELTPGAATGPIRIIVIGLGEPAKDATEPARIGAARAARAAVAHQAKSLAIVAHDPTDADVIRAVAEGAGVGAYQYDAYLTDHDRKVPAVRRVDLCSVPAAAREACRRGSVVAEAVCLTRDLVNEPPSRLDPQHFGERASEVASEKGLRCKVHGPREIEKIGLRAMLAVSRGSARPPRLVHLTHTPTKKKRGPKVLLVGKGVTFDSGGLDLKPAEYMETMKCDMAGAGAVLGAMSALSELGCPLEVHALLGLVENMTGADAYKPGDILETYSGKTVEVLNTDAEGRLVLCDALAWGIETLKPDLVIDVATLTGACVVALGLRSSGVFTRDTELASELVAAATAAGEKFWPMPMYDEYLAQLQRGPADMRNIGGRWGGAITAALFLGEFVPRSMRWAHLDIAGPAFTEVDLPDAPIGGTGAAVGALLRWIESLS